MRQFDALKQLWFESLLPYCPFMVVYNKTPGVQLPSFLIEREHFTRLRAGEDPNVLGIPDLLITPTGWAGTLIFNNTRHYVCIPWEAIVSFDIQKPFIGPQVNWPCSKDVIAASTQPMAPPPAPPTSPTKPAGQAPKATGKRPNHLRLV